MTRMVSVFLPNWPIERLSREKNSAPCPADRPFALVGSEERGLVLTALNDAACRASLYPGLGLADARAICPHLLTAPAAPAKDAEALEALANWSSRYSPCLNVDGIDGLWLDVTGIPHLFGGERQLLSHIKRRFADFGFAARLALAETLGAAYALARFADEPQLIVPAGKVDQALASLPVEGLRLAPETTQLLRRLGLKRIGQLYGLPRASLERRFHSRDAAEAVLERLDQARGKRDEPRTPLLPQADYSAKLPFPEPLITHDGIVTGLDQLAHALCLKLGNAGRGARFVRLAVYRADGSTAMVDAGLSTASRKHDHLSSLLKDKVAAIDAGFGVDLMVLAALRTEPLLPDQTTFARGAELALPESVIDRLANRLSFRAVRRMFPRESHIPEREQILRSAFSPPPSWEAKAAQKPPRPMLLLPEPEPLAVLAQIPDGPPARFTWRRVTRRVIKAEGPERIAQEWWRTLRASSRPYGARTRDYYRIEDEDGRRYWVYRDGLYQDADGAPSWYLHGMFG